MKTLLLMKMLAILMLVASLHVSARGIGQRVTLNEKKASLSKIIRNIKQQTGYQFFYSDELLAASRPVSIKVKNAPLREVLDACFSDQPLNYLVENDAIIIVARINNELSAAPVQAMDTMRLVTGKIINEKGEPVPGATVSVHGADIAVAANELGEFRISVPDEKNELLISSVGYNDIRIGLGRSGYITVTMKEKITIDNEVVVVAYGTQKRKDMIGSVSKITSQEIANSS